MSLKKRKQVKIILSNPLDRREFIGYEMIDWAGKTVARLGRFFINNAGRLRSDSKDVQLTRSLEQKWDAIQHLDLDTYKNTWITRSTE